MKHRDDRRAYPWLCVLLGHRWFQLDTRQGWYRFGSCRRCSHVEVPFVRERAAWTTSPRTVYLGTADADYAAALIWRYQP